jgi:hypothetical protein
MSSSACLRVPPSSACLRHFDKLNAAEPQATHAPTDSADFHGFVFSFITLRHFDKLNATLAQCIAFFSFFSFLSFLSFFKFIIFQ